MISPEYLKNVMDATEASVDKINKYILKRIVIRIEDAFTSDDGKLIIPATKADMKLLMKGGMVYSDIEKEVTKRLPYLKKEIKQAFFEAAQEISEESNRFAKKVVESEELKIDVPDFEKVGLPKSAEKLQMTPSEIRILEDAYRRTNATVENFTKTTAKTSQTAFMSACDDAYAKAKRGIPVGQAISEAITELASNGITAVDYISGRTDKVEVAVARAVRTGINQANSEIVLQRCAEMGVNYVKVSEHLGARVTKNDDFTNHSWWQGKVYKLNWKDDILKEYHVEDKNEKGFAWLRKIRDYFTKKEKSIDYPDFVQTTGYGHILGLCGINCRHTFTAFYPGVNIDRGQTIDREKNEVRYKQEQKLRAMERAMRSTNKELQALKELKSNDPDIMQAIKNTRAKLKSQSDKYAKYCQKTGLKPRNYALKIK